MRRPRPGPRRAWCRSRPPRPARERASFTVEAVEERERKTDHDVAAFVDVVAESVGEHGRWIHYGLTSSDVLDTALALQLREAGELVLASARAYRDALVERAKEHRDTLCVGRTHGVHAEPTTFGLRLAGFAFEADRNLQRLEQRLRAARLRQALGRGRHLRLGAAPQVEARVMERLGLQREDVATQIVPRDRHSVLTSRIAIAGGGLERFATEVRNLQRTEVREVEEPFGSAQKGSSAMPHKRNPIRTERITGLARVLRGYAQVGLENIALWHERDISHSGAERVILPDATIALDYMQDMAAKVAERDDDPHRADAEKPRADPRRPVQPARADRAGRVGDDPRRRLPPGPGERPARLGRGHRVPRADRRRGAPARPGRRLRLRRLPHARARGHVQAGRAGTRRAVAAARGCEMLAP